MNICTIKLGKQYCPPFVVPADVDVDTLSRELGKSYMLEGGTLYLRGTFDPVKGTIVACSKVLHKWKAVKNEK